MSKKNKRISCNNYKDENVIFSIFNASQSLYNRYLDLKEGDMTAAQNELNTAGNKLYQAYELGLKCYLNKKYRELYNNKMLDWPTSSKLSKIIERGYQDNRSMVDTAYLYSQMLQYADPSPVNSGVDFDVIKQNAKWVNNDNKHRGDDIDQQKYNQSYAEIRKYIITYLDSNAQIQLIQSPEFVNLQEACDYWEKDSRYNYCLITDRTNLGNLDLKKIMYINWSLVFDLDPDSENNGLAKAFYDEYHIQPNYFNVLNPKQTELNEASLIPYWFYVNGLSEFKESLVDNERMWKQKYGSQLMECMSKYRATFTKPLKIIILSGSIKRLMDIITALDAVYGDNLYIYLLSAEVQFEPLKEDYREILKYFPITPEEFVIGINNYASMFNKSMKNEDYYIVSRDGKVGIKLEEYSCFEIPYIGIADNEPENINEKVAEAFYQGKCQLSWYGAKNSYAINRISQYRKLKKAISDAAIERTSKIVDLRHEPGAGGTTLARLIAYELSKEMPVVILASYNDKITSKQIENLYRLVRMSILIVVEGSIISKEDLHRFNGELMANAIPHVFLYVNRLNKVNNRNDEDLLTMIDSEFKEMFEKLEVYMDEPKKSEIKGLVRIPAERYPFFMALRTFEDNFSGTKEYIEHFLTRIDKCDFDTLVYISLADKFANRALDINFFLPLEIDDPIGIFKDNVNKNLVTLLSKGKNSFIKIRHPKFADEILDARIGQNLKDISDKQKAENLSEVVRDFIKYSKQHIMLDLDSTIDILRNLLILRDADSLVRDRFAPVITYIYEMLPKDSTSNDQYNCIGLIFKELVSVYPEEAHFRAHLSRYYSHIEENYERGIEEAKAAVKLAECQNIYDALLYHIAAMSIRKYVECKLFKIILDCRSFDETVIVERYLSDAKECLKEASSLLKQVRETNNKVAGYISDIEMCIAVVDFGKAHLKCSTEEFLEQYRDSWYMEYYDRALTLMEGFKNLQVEEDTEFYKVKLSTKCNESLKDMLVNIENTVEMWETYLSHATEQEQPVIRRFIARAKEIQINKKKDYKGVNINRIIQLMEENIRQEPENGANIRIWFNALRHASGKEPEILLDEAISKLGSWKKLGDNCEAYYYYFILVCIKAIEGSSRAEAIIPMLQEELKNKTAHMPNNRVIYEWLGEGKGVGRLVNAYSNGDSRSHKKSLDEIEEQGAYIEGRISKYGSDRSARIRAYNMEVFYSPSGQSAQTTVEDLNKKVRFILGFSYDGLRALNKSVILSGSNELINNDLLYGKLVKCKVIGTDNSGKFLKVKLMDYHNQYGSIHISEMQTEQDIFKYSYGNTLWATVIGNRYLEKELRTYLQLSLKDQQEALTDWQKELNNIKDRLN